MIVCLPNNQNLTSIIIGQIYIVDPDIKENFTFKFNQRNYSASIPAMNSYSIISDDGSIVYVIFLSFFLSSFCCFLFIYLF